MTVKIDGSTGVDKVQPGSVDKEDLKWVPPFTKEYVSPEQTITAAGLLTLTHGLGVTPKSAIMVLICKTAELGYSVGDELHISQAFDANLRPSALVCGPTTIKVKYSADVTGVFGTANLTSGVFGILANANWRLVVRAWA